MFVKMAQILSLSGNSIYRKNQSLENATKRQQLFDTVSSFGAVENAVVGEIFSMGKTSKWQKRFQKKLDFQFVFEEETYRATLTPNWKDTLSCKGVPLLRPWKVRFCWTYTYHAKTLQKDTVFRTSGKKIEFQSSSAESPNESFPISYQKLLDLSLWFRFLTTASHGLFLDVLSGQWNKIWWKIMEELDFQDLCAKKNTERNFVTAMKNNSLIDLSLALMVMQKEGKTFFLRYLLWNSSKTPENRKEARIPRLFCGKRRWKHCRTKTDTYYVMRKSLIVKFV